MKPLPELMSFLEGLSEPHILFDTAYRILAANAAYRRQFSPEHSVVGRTCYEVSHHFSVPCDQAGESCFNNPCSTAAWLRVRCTSTASTKLSPIMAIRLDAPKSNSG